MKKLRNLAAAALAAVLMLACSITAFAAEPVGFADVPADAPYAEAAAYMKQQGWVNGVGNNMLAPDRLVTAGELNTVIGRVLYGNLSADKIVQKGIDDGWIDAMLYNTSSPAVNISAEHLYKTIFLAAGFHAYLPGSDADWTAAATSAAKKIGVCDADITSNQLMTRGQMVNAIYDIFIQKDTLTFTPTDRMQLMNLQYADYVPTSYIQRTVILGNSIPDALWTYFDDQNGEIVMDTDEINKLGIPSVGGMYRDDTNTIYLSSPNSLVHEMGHFVLDEYNLTSAVKKAFNAEKDQIKKTLGEYATTNYGEMFAEAFQGYLTSKYTRQSIETNMPMTWSILEDLSARWAA